MGVPLVRHPLLLAFCGWTCLLLVLAAAGCRSGGGTPAACAAAAAQWGALSSPRWLADVVAFGGPLLAWVPLAAALALQPHHAAVGAARAAGVRALTASGAVFFAGVMAFRFGRRVAPGGWDPSGHVFIAGLQLVPLWGARAGAREGGAGGGGKGRVSLRGRIGAAIAAAVLLVLEAAALWVSATTAAFYHTPSEVLAAWAAVGGAAALAAASSSSRGETSAPNSSSGLSRPARIAGALWLVSTLVVALAVLPSSSSSSSWARLGPFLGYDAATAAFLAALGASAKRWAVSSNKEGL